MPPSASHYTIHLA